MVMAPFFPSTLVRALGLRQTASSTSLSSRYLHQPPLHSYATQSYGGGQGDPKGENPQDQGVSPVTSNVEHPGPAPPDVGQAPGGGASKKESQGQGGNDATSSSSQGKDDASGGSRADNAAQPKIHNPDAPHPDNHSEEVKRHNEEFANRGEKPV